MTTVGVQSKAVTGPNVLRVSPLIECDGMGSTGVGRAEDGRRGHGVLVRQESMGTLRSLGHI